MRRSFFSLPVFATATSAWMLIAAFLWVKGMVALGPDAPSLTPANLWLTTQSMLLWGAFSMFILTASQRLEFERGRRWIALFAHLAFALLINVADVALDALINLFTKLEQATFAQRFNAEVFINTFSYIVVAAVGYALVYHQRLHDSRLGATELQRQLAQARLESLARTLQPHFLFNALNSVAALVRLNENPRALQAVVALGDLLRTVLKTRGEALTPLEDELEFIERYVAVERLRFEEQLRVEYLVQPEARRALVPALILQPLVENAIRHGITRRITPGRVDVRAWEGDGRLHLAVCDDGVGLPKSLREGVGLGITRARLLQLYGKEQRVDLRSPPGGGAVCALSIPLRLADAAEVAR
jgi:two-component system LytT family sensor kinase